MNDKKEKTIKTEDEDSVYAEERRGRAPTTGDKIMRVFWDLAGPYLMIFAAAIHIAFVVGGFIFLASMIQKHFNN